MNNSFLKLPLLFDRSLLLKDLLICENSIWKDHFNTNDYEGSWKAISLRSPSGNSTDILAHNTEQAFEDTELLSKCDYFKEILDQFKFEKETVRLLRLAPESVIKEHRDIGLAYRFGEFRLHIPIQTETTVSFIVGGKNIPMKTAECWYADFDLPHSVINNSTKERIHLVIDGKRNKYSDELFIKAGYDLEEEKRSLDHSIETKIKIIEQLKLMNTDAANTLISKLENELKGDPSRNKRNTDE